MYIVDFIVDKYYVVFGVDDYIVKLWDILNFKEILIFKEYFDYVRCGCVSKFNLDFFIIGLYDYIVKMFDV